MIVCDVFNMRALCLCGVYAVIVGVSVLCVSTFNKSLGGHEFSFMCCECMYPWNTQPHSWHTFCVSLFSIVQRVQRFFPFEMDDNDDDAACEIKRKRLADHAARFAAKVPNGKYSMAEIQVEEGEV